MKNLAYYYGKSEAEVHTLFYEVSCDRMQLQTLLKAEAEKQAHDVKPW